MERTMSASPYAVVKRQEPLKSALFCGQPARSLSCDVVFGSPNLGCRGTGICKLNANDGMRVAPLQQRCQSATGLLFSLDDGATAVLILPREFLCVNILRNHFRQGLLRMESPCRIPDSIATALGLKFSNLAPGSYPVNQLDGYYRIEFRKP